MYAYRIPSVYFEWRDQSPRRAQPTRTDVTGFVGIASRGPLHRPVRVESWTQFLSVFGGHVAQGYLAPAVEGFFANGGRTCWVVRAADPAAARVATLTLHDDTGRDSLRLHATSPGVWAEQLIATVLRTSRERFALLLQHAEGGQEVWSDLTMAVASTEILNLKHQGLLHIVGIDAGIWDEAQAGRQSTIEVLPREDGRFDLDINIGTARSERWPSLSFDRTDARYVAAVLNDPSTGSKACTVRDVRVGGAAASLAPRAWTLSIDPRYVRQRLNDAASGSAWVRAEHLPGGGVFPDNSPNARAANLRQGSARLAGGADGLNSLQAQHLAGEGRGAGTECWGLACLRSIDEVSILAMPDIMAKPFQPRSFKPQTPNCTSLELPAEPAVLVPTAPPEHPPQFSEVEIGELQQALVRQCELRKDRVALLDALPEHRSLEALAAWRRNFDSSYAALYVPWLGVPDGARELRLVPPSGHIAGIMARCDHEVGPHKPPANQVVETAKYLAFEADDALHAELTGRQVNLIRCYPGRGLRVSGARTLSSDLDLRYLNVRRLLLLIEAAIAAATQDLVFEPHNSDLWRTLERRARALLDGLWRSGSLDGATAEAAYQVRCDAQTNPPQEQEAGRVICEIGVLPPWPAEFVVVRIGFTQSGAEVLQEGA